MFAPGTSKKPKVAGICDENMLNFLSLALQLLDVIFQIDTYPNKGVVHYTHGLSSIDASGLEQILPSIYGQNQPFLAMSENAVVKPHQMRAHHNHIVTRSGGPSTNLYCQVHPAFATLQQVVQSETQLAALSRALQQDVKTEVAAIRVLKDEFIAALGKIEDHDQMPTVISNSYHPFKIVVHQPHFDFIMSIKIKNPESFHLI